MRIGQWRNRETRGPAVGAGLEYGTAMKDIDTGALQRVPQFLFGSA